MSKVFDRYISEGNAILRAHPDFAQMVGMEESVACDQIASVLHALFGYMPQADAEVKASDVLERALQSFVGDYEDVSL